MNIGVRRITSTPSRSSTASGVLIHDLYNHITRNEHLLVVTAGAVRSHAVKVVLRKKFLAKGVVKELDVI